LLQRNCKRPEADSMAFFNAFPLGTLPVTDELRATCRAVSSACDDASFTSLITSLAAAAVDGSGAASGEAHTALARLGSAAARRATAEALTALLLDFSKCGTPVDALGPALEERGLSVDKAAAFIGVYKARLEQLRASAQCGGAWLQMMARRLRDGAD
jgi:hypothetical protein